MNHKEIIESLFEEIGYNIELCDSLGLSNGSHYIWDIKDPIFGSFSVANFVSKDHRLILKRQYKNSYWRRRHDRKLGRLEVNIADPNSFKQIKENLNSAWRERMREEVWDFIRLSTFWGSLIGLLALFLFLILTTDQSHPTSMLNSTADSLDFERTITILEEVINQITVNPDNPCTTIFFIYDPYEDVKLFKEKLIEYKEKFQQVVSSTENLPLKEAHAKRFPLLKEYQEVMFEIQHNSFNTIYPNGMGRYPYNREIFIFEVFTLVVFFVSLFLNRHWF